MIFVHLRLIHLFQLLPCCYHSIIVGGKKLIVAVEESCLSI